MTASHHTAPPPTSTLRVVSLRLWLPLLLVGAACVVLCIMLGVQYHQFQQDIEHFIQETAHEDALHAQRELETILRREDGSGLDGVVTQLGLRKTVVHAALVDGLGNVRAATRLAWRGQRAHAVVPDYPLPLIAQALQRQREVLDWQPATQRLLVVTPVGFPLQQNEIRNARKGLLLIAYDLQPLRAQSWQAVRQHVLVFGTLILLSALLMVWLARRWVLLPVQALQARMQRIGEGDFSPGPAWKGHGELRLLNDSLESMAQHLQDSQRSLKESQGRYRQLADAAFEAIIIHDGGVILHANIAAEKMLGMAPGSLSGRPAMSIIAEHEHTEILERMQHRIEGVWLVDMVDAQGALIPCEMSVRQQDVDGKVLRLAAMRDLRERLAAERRIRELTLYDPLTGLSNRQRLLALLAEVLGEVQRDSQHAALVAFNLNAFQSINDSLGMAVGDGVLRALARRLSARLERNQVLGRVQGDTFALLITNLEGGLQSASALAASSVERLLANIGEPLHIQEHVLYLSAGAGVVMVGDAQHDAAELLRQAETAMHEAKDGGDNRVQFFAPALQQAASARLTLRNELRSVLRQPPGGLLLHYQPQVNQHGQLHGVEALVRWQHAQRGLIPPGMFIAEAEDSGLIVPLGQWVLEEALHCLRRWQRHGANTPHDWAANLTMAVNVSARQFREADFVAAVRRALARSGVAPTALELELTESVVADDLDATLAKIAELRALGVRFALDDFGTGYSSLAYLKRLPIDLLKIDRSFVMDIDAEPDSSLDGAAGASAQGKRPAVLIDAIVALAHQLELQVLAEGVETPAQLARLAQVGCDLYQGYHFSRPLPEDALLAWAEAAAQAGAAP